MTAHSGRAIWMRVISLSAIGFGLLTLQEGGAVLFVDGAARQAAGHYVPFVLWFNFLAGFAYIVAGVGLWMRRRWAMWLAVQALLDIERDGIDDIRVPRPAVGRMRWGFGFDGQRVSVVCQRL